MGAKTSAALFILVLAAPFAAQAGISISEIMFDPEGSDSKREWIELYNAGPDAVNIAEWKYADKANHALNVPPKNGGVGSMMIAPGRYFILASDAATFVAEHPGISIVIDTTMSLNNSGATIGLRSGTSVIDSATYTKSMGAAGNGDSLQLNEGTWIHAKPTPGTANATSPSVAVTQASSPKKVAPAKTAPLMPATVTTGDAIESNDPLSIVNATPSDTALSQTAAAGTLRGSVWWIAAAALAIGTGAVASLISRSKKFEWDIEESE